MANRISPEVGRFVSPRRFEGEEIGLDAVEMKYRKEVPSWKVRVKHCLIERMHLLGAGLASRLYATSGFSPGQTCLYRER